MPLLASAPALSAQVAILEALWNSHARGDARSRRRVFQKNLNLTSFVFSTLSKSELFLFRFRFRSEMNFLAPASQITASETLNFLLSFSFAREFGVWCEQQQQHEKSTTTTSLSNPLGSGSDFKARASI